MWRSVDYNNTFCRCLYQSNSHLLFPLHTESTAVATDGPFGWFLRSCWNCTDENILISLQAHHLLLLIMTTSVLMIHRSALWCRSNEGWSCAVDTEVKHQSSLSSPGCAFILKVSCDIHNWGSVTVFVLLNGFPPIFITDSSTELNGDKISQPKMLSRWRFRDLSQLILNK